jgi:methionyl aminopeptidase
MIRSRPSSGPEVELAFAAAQCVVRTHQRMVTLIRAGMTLAEVDGLVARTLAEQGAKSCFLHYAHSSLPAFPSHACLSVNECIVHGTHDYLSRPLARGDLLKLDIGVELDGWIGDAGWTYAIGAVPPGAEKLMKVGKESLRRGVQTLRPGNRLRAWADEVTRCVERENGLFLVEQLGGHGYGRTLHAEPFVSNLPPGDGVRWTESRLPLKPGMLLAVEPMLALGTRRIASSPRAWPIFTADGSLSVHYEHDVLITETGPRVLTEGMDALPDVVG